MRKEDRIIMLAIRGVELEIEVCQKATQEIFDNLRVTGLKDWEITEDKYPEDFKELERLNSIKKSLLVEHEELTFTDIKIED